MGIEQNLLKKVTAEDSSALLKGFSSVSASCASSLVMLEALVQSLTDAESSAVGDVATVPAITYLDRAGEGFGRYVP